MPTPWLGRIRRTGQLSVFNKATAWSGPVAAAIQDFNHLAFGVRLVVAAEERNADVVLILATGPTKHSHFGDTVETAPDFVVDDLHGQCSTLTDKRRNEIFFAGVFLPGKVKDATAGQKEVIVLHELIHAAGMNEKNDHDSVGIMFFGWKREDGKLLEYMPEKGARPMPPIRVGAKTLCTIKSLWSGENACRED